MIDTAKLLEFLDSRKNARNVLVGSVYEGLASRIRAGEFEADSQGDGSD